MKNIHFIDIETVPASRNIPKHAIGDIWTRKMTKDLQEEWHHSVIPSFERDEHYFQKSGLYAEFGKIVCISIGKMSETKFYVKSLYGTDEKEILTKLCELMDNAKSKPSVLCGHNILDFDIPFITRRILVNGITLPAILNNYDRKPWESPYKDTMKMWSSTQWNYKVSLELLCEIFGLQSPKQIMDGKSVADLYYSEEEGRLEKIATYCSGDVVATANVYAKMMGLPIIEQSQIEYL